MTREELFKNLKAGARWDVGVSINRSNSLPLDANSIFESYAAAAAYASKDATRIAPYGFLNNAYIGQIIAVIEDKTVGDATVTTVGIYYIDADLKLQPVGKEVVADGNTIVNDNGTIKLYGFDAAGAATYPRKTAEGKIEWVTVDQVVAGATKNTITIGDNVTISTTGSIDDGYTASLVGSNTATHGQVPFFNVVEGAEGTTKSLVWKDVYTKAEIDTKIAGLLTYRGTAHHVSDSLDYIYVTEGADGIKADPTNLGHVYIVGDKEYVSNGNKWEELGFTTNVDLSGYYTKTETDAAIDADVLVETNRATAAEEGLGNRITAIENLKIDETYAKASDLTTLEGTVTTLSGDLTTLTGRVGTAEGNITTLQGQFTDLDTTVSGHTQLLSGLRTDVDAKVAQSVYDEYVEVRTFTDEQITNKIAAVNVNDRVATLEGAVGNDESGLVQKVNKNTSDLVSVTNRLTSLEGKDESILTQIGTVSGKVDKNITDIASLNASVTTYNTILAGFDATTTVKSVTDANATAAANAKTIAEGAVAGVNTNAQNITSLTGRVDTAEGKITTIEGNITTINGRLDTAEGDISSIKGRVDTAEGKIATLEGQITGLTGAMHFRGVSTTDPTGENGPTLTGIENPVWVNGDVVIYGKQEYVFDGTNWVLFGDEGSYALKDSVYTKTEIDGKVTTIENNYTAAIATAKGEAIAEAATDATTKANAAEANAKAYVDAALTWGTMEDIVTE